jgi:hypothetical protein
MRISPPAVKGAGVGAVLMLAITLTYLGLSGSPPPLSGTWVDEGDPYFRLMLLVDGAGRVDGSGGYLNDQRKSTSFEVTGQASDVAVGLRFGGSSFTGSLHDGKLTGILYQPAAAPQSIAFVRDHGTAPPSDPLARLRQRVPPNPVISDTMAP